MRKLYLLLLILAAVTSLDVIAQDAPADTIYNPNVIFTGIPRTYEIAGITVKGADNYNDFTVIGYSG